MPDNRSRSGAGRSYVGAGRGLPGSDPKIVANATRTLHHTALGLMTARNWENLPDATRLNERYLNYKCAVSSCMPVNLTPLIAQDPLSQRRQDKSSKDLLIKTLEGGQPSKSIVDGRRRIRPPSRCAPQANLASQTRCCSSASKNARNSPSLAYAKKCTSTQRHSPGVFLGRVRQHMDRRGWTSSLGRQGLDGPLGALILRLASIADTRDPARLNRLGYGRRAMQLLPKLFCLDRA